MTRCPSCAHENDEYATVCSNCRAFLQNRVPNLNLFETSWGILESPRTTFRTIALAEHKNYAFLLFCGFGVAVSFAIFWYLRLGVYFDTLMQLLPFAFMTGLVLGPLSAVFLTLLHHGVVRMLGSPRKMKQTYAMLAYACVPVVLSMLILLPIELMTFGMFLFTANPNPAVIKPASFYILISLDALCALWTIILAVKGTRIVHSFTVPRAILAVGIVLAMLLGTFFLGADWIPVLLEKTL